MRIFTLSCVVAASIASVFAQTAPPNDLGISLGHIHFVVPDPDAMNKAWKDVFGAVEGKAGTLGFVKIPGMFIIVSKANMPPETSATTVHHVGIAVQDYAATKAKAAAAGIMWRDLGPEQAFATFPDAITVEVMGDKNLKTPVAFHHIHESVTDGEAARAWYMKEFGATSGTRRNLPAAMMTGGEEVDFLKANMPPAGTKGHALDHIGFEVKDLAATLKRLESDGVTINMPLRDMTKQIELKIAFVTDPNGTYIELTEGLAAK
jgi:catechol 2,3-dioxygenase-like lactoylglutathione lyase family enzyme